MPAYNDASAIIILFLPPVRRMLIFSIVPIRVVSCPFINVPSNSSAASVYLLGK